VFPPDAEIILESDKGEKYGSLGIPPGGIDLRRW